MENEHSEAVRDTIESHIESRRADDEFQERLAASTARFQRILERLAEWGVVACELNPLHNLRVGNVRNCRLEMSETVG